MDIYLILHSCKSSFCRFVTIWMLMLVSVPAIVADNWKVVEKSEKHVPSWVYGGGQKGTLLVSTVAPSLQEARIMAEKDLMRSIVQAVATNVTHTSSEYVSNVVDNGNVATREEFLSNLELAAAKLPFIKGVSLSEAIGQYWERRENKSNKQTEYYLNVLYPMPESELEKMRHDFEKYDADKTAEYKRLESNYDNVTTLDQISSAVASLDALAEYFFDSVRKSEAIGLQKRYNNLYGMVTISANKTDDKEFIVRTMLRDKPFATGKIPEVTSQCASKIKVDPIENGTAFRVTYSDEDCLEDEQNSLKASIRLSTARLSTTMHF